MSSEKNTPSLEKTITESAVYALSNPPVTCFTIVGQNLKVELQTSNKTYQGAFSHLLQQGPKRFLNGYSGYTSKNMLGSAICGPAMRWSSQYAENRSYSPSGTIAFTTLAATAAETALTGYSEGKELNATKQLPLPMAGNPGY
jgi:hypothetical protein